MPTQHKLLVTNIKLAKVIYSKNTAKKQITLWRLSDEKIRKKMEKEVEQASLYQVETWDEWNKGITEVTKEVRGVTNRPIKRKTSG